LGASRAHHTPHVYGSNTGFHAGLRGATYIPPTGPAAPANSMSVGAWKLNGEVGHELTVSTT
jgi:hypothetical protein